MPETSHMHETVAEGGIAMQPPAKAGNADSTKPWLARWQPRQRLARLAHKRLSARNWLRRWIFRDPPDPRIAARQKLSGLDAYFFTGGKPEPHPIRDVSATGVYVRTNVRWYVGTVVRVTLTDRKEPTDDRSFTVEAKVVRSGRDGVGFRYELEKGEVPRKRTFSDDLLGESVPKTRAELFLERMQSSGED